MRPEEIHKTYGVVLSRILYLDQDVKGKLFEEGSERRITGILGVIPTVLRWRDEVWGGGERGLSGR